MIRIIWPRGACAADLPPTCVSDHVVQHHQPLELRLQLLADVLRQRLRLKSPQPVVGFAVALHEQLEGAHLEVDAINNGNVNIPQHWIGQ